MVSRHPNIWDNAATASQSEGDCVTILCASSLPDVGGCPPDSGYVVVRESGKEMGLHVQSGSRGSIGLCGRYCGPRKYGR